MSKIPRFEGEIVDLVLSSLTQDAFRTQELETLIERAFDDVLIEQLRDSIQILYKYLRVLEKAQMKKQMQLWVIITC